MVRAAWDNRHAPLYAWRVLSRGVRDGCALGVSGFRDWTARDALVWSWAFLVLVPGPALGVLAMLRLRARPEAALIAGGRG